MSNPGNVLITGGSSGLGAAVVDAVLAAGGRPLVVDRQKPPERPGPSGRDTAGPDTPSSTNGVLFAQADVADASAVRQAVERLVDQAGGRLDGVFTAAGIDCCGKLDEVDAKDWENVIAVDLLGTAAAVRAALPHIKASRGRVVTCASTLGIKAVSDATAYCAAKFGVVGFTRALAAETAGEIGVTLLIPGGMHTAFFDGRDEQYKPPPDAKLNQPADVARTVVFALGQPPGCEVRELVVCASEESSWP